MSRSNETRLSTLAKTGLSRLRDPIWQALGVFLALVTFMASTYVAYDIYVRTTASTSADIDIVEQYWYLPLQESPNERIKILVEDTPIDFLAVYRWSVTNSGEVAVKPDDFVEPIGVKIAEPWHLLFVETGFTNPSELTVSWNTNGTNSFTMNPTLLNAGDSFEVLLYLTNADLSQSEISQISAMPNVEWSGRITNVASLAVEPLQPQFSLSSFLLGYTVYHSGIALWMWFGISSVFMAVSFGTVSSMNSVRKLSGKAIVVLIVAANFSFASAEIVTDVLLPSQRFGDMRAQPLFSWLIILTFAASLSYLWWLRIQKLIGSSSSAEAQENS